MLLARIGCLHDLLGASTTTDYNGPVRAENLWHHTVVNDAFALIWNHTFSPTLLNQARGNAAGWRYDELASNPQEPFGLPQANIENIGSIQPEYFGATPPVNTTSGPILQRRAYQDSWTSQYQSRRGADSAFLFE